MLINAIDPEESRIAVVEDGVLQELHVELANREAYLGNIYKGKVVNIEPSIGAAFVAFGGRVNGFLHVSDVLPAYGRPEFMLDDVIEGRARVDVDDGPESMQQALADDDDDEGGDAGPAKAGPRGGPEDHDGDEPEIEPSNVTVAEHDDEAAVEPVDPAEHEHGHHKDAVDADAGADGPRGADEPPPGGGGEDDGFGDGIERPLNMAAAGDGPEGDGADGDGGPEAGPAATPTPTSAAPDGGDAVVNGSADGATDGDADAAGAAGPGGGGDKRGRRNRRGGNRDRSGERRPRGPRGSKGPTLTTYVSLPGRCLVLMPSLPKCGVSRKIEDARERKRLKRIVRELDETGSGGIGFIVRTAGVNKSLQDLQRDRDYLKKIWEMVAQRLKVTRAPALLYQESDLVLKAMRDQFTPDIADVVVDSEDVFLRIRDFAEKLMPHMADRIKQHAMTTPLFHHFGIEKEVEALYQPKIDLPNGASIVIDQAEALVAIDVNSGKYKAGGDSDETAYRTNLDAIPEIVRQLRLRDLGGLIIIDFIDMAHEKHRRGVEKRLIDALHGDRARIKVGRISPFGMLEITRQRVGPGLKRTVFMQCPHCKGAGWSRTVQSKALSVLRESRALVNLKGYSVLQVFAAPAVTDYLVNHKRRAVLELEDAVGKTILFRPEASYPIDVVHYRFLTGDGQEARIAIPAGLGVKA
ncbi:MAG: Rne/Rng family ribonuclease [Planctomycetes bacterium]|nr:Rne/Rng family ribonuclease [Planctomycetota bacterium]